MPNPGQIVVGSEVFVFPTLFPITVSPRSQSMDITCPSIYKAVVKAKKGIHLTLALENGSECYNHTANDVYTDKAEAIDAYSDLLENVIEAVTDKLNECL